MTPRIKSMTRSINRRGPELTVAAGLARGLMEFAAAKGASLSVLAERSGIDPRELDDQDHRVPFAKYVTLMRAAKGLCNDPALALHFGAANDLSQISVVGLIANASETMGEALLQLNRYGRLVVEFDGAKERFRTEFRGPEVWVIDCRENPNHFPELTESTFARMICGPRRFGIAQIARAVHVTHKAPDYRAEYERVLGAPVTFEREENAMLVDPLFAGHRIASQPRYVFGLFSEHADALLTELESSKSVRGKVESLLMPILHTGNAGMDAITEKMALSRQTLARKLKAEGTTFEKVLDGLRHRLALDYLQARKVSVNETAYLVGFSEPAAFSRAFKRWTGTSPKAMRNVSR
jgi:AraC-like DNA-binding protein